MTIFTGGSGGGFDWTAFATNAANIAGQILAQKQQLKMLKAMNRGGAMLSPAALGFSGGVPATVPAAVPALGAGVGGLTASLTLPSVGGIADMLPGGLEEIGSGTGVFGPDLFEPAKRGQRARRFIRAVNPSTGNETYWRHVGAPLLFRGDLGVCKLVNRVAARAARGVRARGGRFRRKRC
jgi:hypothetical protein